MTYTRERMREYMAARRSAVKSEMLALLGGRCVRCGTSENLEFDHINPADKSFEINGRSLDLPSAAIRAEVAKCQLLCAAHHLEKTASDMGWAEGVHGRSSTYQRGCRCDECREWNARRNREGRARRRIARL